MLNKSNMLAIGVILIALGLYLQIAYIIEGNQIGEYFKKSLNESMFTLLVTILFWGGILVSVVSLVIKPKKRRIVIPVETPGEEVPQEGIRTTYGVEEPVETSETSETEVEQSYEEPSTVSEEAFEEPSEEEEKPGKVGEVIGFCPRCGAPVTEGIRYCRKCGLKLK